MQIDHILIESRAFRSKIDVRSFQSASTESDLYLVREKFVEVLSRLPKPKSVVSKKCKDDFVAAQNINHNFTYVIAAQQMMSKKTVWISKLQFINLSVKHREQKQKAGSIENIIVENQWRDVKSAIKRQRTRSKKKTKWAKYGQEKCKTKRFFRNKKELFTDERKGEKSAYKCY